MLHEKEISDLLAKLKDVNQPHEVRQWALAQLLAHHSALQAYLRNDFKANLPESEVMLTEVNNAYDRLRQQLNMGEQSPVSIQKTPRRILLYRWSSIAAAVLVCIGCIWLYRHQTNKPLVIAAVLPPAPPNAIKNTQFDTISNTGLSVATHELLDGSTVELKPGSSIIYSNGYPIIKKEIYLEGSALFTVHNEVRRPFSVFINGIEVVDKGTVFSIISKESLVRVRLIQGKVTIHSVNPRIRMQDIQLKPGQEFMIDTTTKAYAVNFVSPQKTVGKLNRELAFKNTSLVEVFDRLGKESGITINYNKREISDMAFTGIVDNGSNAYTIIARICLLNELHYEIKKNTIYIHM